jgi:prevent-host-death family protein
MAKMISQRELRNDSGDIMRAVDAGASFVVTRNGAPVAELTPLHRRRFVSIDVVLAAFKEAPPIDARRFRKDVDAFATQDAKPRA